MTPWLAALVCLTLAPGARATDDLEPSEVPIAQKDTLESQTGKQEMHQGEMSPSAPEASFEASPKEGAPTRCDKASSILGMDVCNQNDEHLGHLKELVIDWKTEQVSYAVISTAPKAMLGMGGKLLAVPLSALATSADKKHLILNADKSKVEAAMGFDSNNWPSVSSPTWGAQPFWQGKAEKASVPDQPATESEIKAKPKMTPDTDPETGPESKIIDDPESPPDMEHDSESDQGPGSQTDSTPDVR
jgi:sporulation protein YlmC with PRC-barrel domain